MKRLLFLAVLLLIVPVGMLAQQNSIRYQGDLGLQMGAAFLWNRVEISDYETISGLNRCAPGAVITTTHGLLLNDAVTIAAGVGVGPACAIDPHTDPLQAKAWVVLSLFTHFDYAFLRGNPMRPFVAARLGYSYFGEKEKMGGMPNAGVGAGIRLNDQWDFSIWYRLGFGGGKTYPNEARNERYLVLNHTPFIGCAWRFPGYKKARNK